MNEPVQGFSDKIHHYQYMIYDYDYQTYSHGQKVAHISLMIGGLLGLAEHEKLIVYGAALIHDIGKIKLPIELLHKKGSLTQKEWQLIKEHPAKGAEIIGCDQDHSLKKVHDIILYHHEQVDGKGYPFGLKGHDIPLGVKIIAIADAIDAMLTYRPYRQGIKNMHQALKEIVDKAGTQFDFIIARKIAIAFNLTDDISVKFSSGYE